jgi:hypothetical protein
MGLMVIRVKKKEYSYYDFKYPWVCTIKHEDGYIDAYATSSFRYMLFMHSDGKKERLPWKKGVERLKEYKQKEGYYLEFNDTIFFHLLMKHLM